MTDFVFVLNEVSLSFIGMVLFFGVIQMVRLIWWIYCNSGIHSPTLM